MIRYDWTVLQRRNQMQTEDLIRLKDEISARYGEWSGHNIHIQDGVYTIGPRVIRDEFRLRRLVQCVLDLFGGSVEGKRVLDLACHEGLFSIEFARRNAKCLGIEGREANIEKARFVKNALSLENLDFVQDDVRNVSVERYGTFDVILCLGILYHLDVPDVFAFIERLGEVCQHVCIVDTRITLHPKERVTYKNATYHGVRGDEHDPGDSQSTKLARLWASLDNVDNFYLSRATLCNALAHAGFTSVFECNIPAVPKLPEDRQVFVAIKGHPSQPICSPLMDGMLPDEMPERPFREHSRPIDLIRAASRPLPRRLRRILKRGLGLENKLT
jgi:2-polyprenyl-3-methyl-5-hydroxy-6-metoxy-1,4-benzoquinol methylase